METSDAIRELRTKLTEENQKYFDVLLIKVDTFSLVKVTKNLDETLLTLIQDYLPAQKDGRTAQEYFGLPPEKLADDLFQQTEHPSIVRRIFSSALFLSVILSFIIQLQNIAFDKQFSFFAFLSSSVVFYSFEKLFITMIARG
ncbi:MAG: hypothetical protein LBM95_02470 [Lactobacillales bacterium]|jgi:hypothetical protein|nr:hypothetical protein [Lactobacillales bacterium]